MVVLVSECGECKLTATTRKPHVDIDDRELIEYLWIEVA